MEGENFSSKKNKRNIQVFAFFIITILPFLINTQLIFSQSYHEVGLTYSDGRVYSSVNYEVNIAELKIDKSQILSFSAPKETHIIISLYEQNGNFVKLLVYDNIPAGKYIFNLKNQIPSGNYVCKITAGEINESVDFIIQ